jgi:hypothetical protein
MRTQHAGLKQTLTGPLANIDERKLIKSRLPIPMEAAPTVQAAHDLVSPFLPEIIWKIGA